MLARNRTVRVFTRAFTGSLVVVTVAMVLLWLAGGTANIAGTSFFDSTSPLGWSRPARAVALLLALGSAPLFMWAGPKFVTSGKRPFSHLQVIWAVIKVPLVVVAFGLTFSALTFVAGSQQLSDALVVPFTGAIGTGSFLALMLAGVRDVAGRGEIGRAINTLMSKVYGVFVAFASGGPRDGLLELVGISGVISLGFGSGYFVFGYLFVLPFIVAVPHVLTWEGSGVVYRWLGRRKGSGREETQYLLEHLVALCNLLAWTACSVMLLIGGAAISNNVGDRTIAPWREVHQLASNGEWATAAGPALVTVWTVTGAIAMWGALLWIRWMREAVENRPESTRME